MTLAVGSELLTIYGMLVIALLALLRIRPAAQHSGVGGRGRHNPASGIAPRHAYRYPPTWLSSCRRGREVGVYNDIVIDVDATFDATGDKDHSVRGVGHERLHVSSV